MNFMHLKQQLCTVKIANKSPAMSGNRTRVNCLEGSYAHHYTNIAQMRKGGILSPPDDAWRTGPRLPKMMRLVTSLTLPAAGNK